MKNTDLYNEILYSVNKKVHNFHTAEEITQEVFLAAVKQDTSKIENIHSYLYSVAKTKMADRYENYENNFLLSIEGVDLVACEIPDYGVVEELLALLSPQERTVVDCKQLTDIAGAEELGISVESFRVIKHRAKQRLKLALEK